MPAQALSALGGLAALLAGPVGSLAFDRGWLRDLPASHDFWSLVETVDPSCIVDRIDGGGLHAGAPGRVGCHGSSWTQASFELDGMDVTDPDRGGTPLLSPDLLALEAVNVVRDRLPTSLGGAGPVFELATRRPNGRWAGSLAADVTGAVLQAAATSPLPIARYGSARHLAALAHGPLAGERLTFLASAAVAVSERLAPESPEPLRGSNRSLLFQMSASPGPGTDARVLFAMQSLAAPFAGRALYAARDTRQTDRRSHAQALWQRTSGGSAVTLSAGHSRGSLDPALEGAPDGVVERLLDGPVSELAPERSRRERWQLEARWRAARGRLDAGAHRLEFGASLSRSSATVRPASPAGLVGETVYGLPARVWEYGWVGPESRRRAVELALDATDRIFPTRRLELAAGLRFEAIDASAAGGGIVRWRTLAPRLASRWRAVDAPALDLYATYGRYHQRLPLRVLAFGDPGGPSGASFLWHDVDGDGHLDASERGALVARLGPGGSRSSIDPELRRPRTDEVVVGAELRPSDAWLLRFQAIHRAEGDLLESVNVGVPLESYRVRSVLDPYVDFMGAADDRQLQMFDRAPESFGLDRYLLTNPADHTMLHEGFELAVEKARGRLRLLLGAAAYRSEAKSGWRGFRAGENDQGLIGELFDDPNADSYGRGRLFFDRNYVVKLAGRYQAPRDLRLSAAVRYQDGQPFARFVVAEDLRQGPDFVHAVPEGRHRFTYTLTLDAHVEKGFRWRAGQLALFAEAFNLLDARNSVEEDVVSAPAFRQRLARFVQPPRALRLGLLLDF